MTDIVPLPSRGRAVVVAGTLLLAVAAVAVARLSPRRGAMTALPTRDVPKMVDGSLVFSKAFRERAGLEFTKAERARFVPNVRVVGTVAFNPSFVAAVGTRLRGTVRRTFKYDGDEVAAGDPLGEVESAELGEAQAAVAQAQAQLDAAERHAKRERTLFEQQLTTAREAEIAEAELSTARSSLQAAKQRVQSFGGDGTFGLFVLRSPLGGHVVEQNVSPGQSVDGTVVAYRVAHLDHLWIELSLFERDLPNVDVGDDVEVSPLAEPLAKIAGKVAHVGEVIDPQTRSTDVRVAVDFPKVHLRAGQSVRATITGSTVARDALLIPRSAVVHFDGKPTIFVAQGDDRVTATTVRLGNEDTNSYEVLEGVQEGELVARAGVFALKSELFR